MKTYLALISTAVLALTACSQEAPKSAEPAPAAASAPAASAPTAAPASPASAPAAPASEATASAPTANAACETTVESNDEMKFNTAEIAISKTCTQYKITLKHVGKMPVTAMGHNLVISKTEDAAGVVADGAAATAAKGFLKEGDARVIATTKLIGGGEEDTITVDTSKLTADGSYEFYCTFPGHYGMMKGVVKVSN